MICTAFRTRAAGTASVGIAAGRAMLLRAAARPASYRAGPGAPAASTFGAANGGPAVAGANTRAAGPPTSAVRASASASGVRPSHGPAPSGARLQPDTRSMSVQRRVVQQPSGHAAPPPSQDMSAFPSASTFENELMHSQPPSMAKAMRSNSSSSTGVSRNAGASVNTHTGSANGGHTFADADIDDPQPSDAATQQRIFVEDQGTIAIEDLTKSYRGISAEPFPPDVVKILSEDVAYEDVEVKPDGMLYLPEIKYRRMLNRAFGPGGWGLVPRGPHTVNNKNISREYALFCLGRFVSQARGEQDFFGQDSLPTASEGCKSNALMRCCKDLGIAWELWDPVFIRKFKAEHAVMVQGTHVTNGTKKWVWRRRDRTLDYPYKEDAAPSARGGQAFR